MRPYLMQPLPMHTDLLLRHGSTKTKPSRLGSQGLLQLFGLVLEVNYSCDFFQNCLWNWFEIDFLCILLRKGIHLIPGLNCSRVHFCPSLSRKDTKERCHIIHQLLKLNKNLYKTYKRSTY